MQILFTDDKEWDDDNSSEDITFVPIGIVPSKTTIINAIALKTITWIKIVNKTSKETIHYYPISQIKRITP